MKKTESSMNMAEQNTEKRKLDKRRLIAYWGAGVTVVLLDQITKVVVDWRFPLNYNQPVIPGIFDLVHVRNYGAAWGMFAGRTWLLGVVSLVALVLLVANFRRMTEGKVFNEWILSIVGGGIAGNMIDRFLRGSVIDFLDFHWKEVYHYPSFNVADMAISVGVCLYVAYAFFGKKKNGAAKDVPK
jgi:signal peptidase II